MKRKKNSSDHNFNTRQAEFKAKILDRTNKNTSYDSKGHNLSRLSDLHQYPITNYLKYKVIKQTQHTYTEID